PLPLNLREHPRRQAKARLAKCSDCIVELDETSLVGLVKNGERTSYFKSSAKRFLPPSSFVDEHDIGVHLSGKRNRFYFSSIELWQDQNPFGAHDFQPFRRPYHPFLNALRSKWMA